MDCTVTVGKTSIQWADYTLNPLVGCTPVSSGCANCYAANLSRSGRLEQYQGVVDDRGNWTGQVNFVPQQIDKLWNFPLGARVFLPSMSDPFHPSVLDEWLDRIFATVALNPQLKALMLTKRPDRALAYFNSCGERIVEMAKSIDSDRFDDLGARIWHSRVPGNLWLGCSVESQAVVERLDYLLEIPARVRFVSAEPLLEEIDLTPYLGGVHWVICGGEFGNKDRVRVFDLAWARSLLSQCRDCKVDFFLKQLGANPCDRQPLVLRDRKGGDISEFPFDLQVREVPGVFTGFTNLVLHQRGYRE